MVETTPDSTNKYNMWDHRKALMDKLNEYSCPYCGMDDGDWFKFNYASGYGSHFSDSDMICKACMFHVPVTGFRTDRTPEGHYVRMQGYAKGRYVYILKEHNKKVQSLVGYKNRLSQYVGDKEIKDSDLE